MVICQSGSGKRLAIFLSRNVDVVASSLDASIMKSRAFRRRPVVGTVVPRLVVTFVVGVVVVVASVAQAASSVGMVEASRHGTASRDKSIVKARVVRVAVGAAGAEWQRCVLHVWLSHGINRIRIREG